MLFRKTYPAPLVTWTLLIATARCQSSQCYTPNGQVDDSAPCNIGATESSCCVYGDVCLSNSYCWSPDANNIYRGGCTDKTWKSNACPLYCNDLFTDQGCSVGPNEDATGFCCHNSWNGTACTVATHNSYNAFVLSRGDIINNRTDGSTSPNVTYANTASTTESNTPATVTVTLASEAQKVSGGHELAVGLGVGLPLGIALIAALFLLWRQSRSLQRTPVVDQAGQSHSSPKEADIVQVSQVKPRHEMYVQPASELDDHSVKR